MSLSLFLRAEQIWPAPGEVEAKLNPKLPKNCPPPALKTYLAQFLPLSQRQFSQFCSSAQRMGPAAIVSPLNDCISPFPNLATLQSASSTAARETVWKHKLGPIPPLLKTPHQLPSHAEWEPKSSPWPTRPYPSSGPDHHSHLLALYPSHCSLNQPHGPLCCSTNMPGAFLAWGLCSSCPLCWNALYLISTSSFRVSLYQWGLPWPLWFVFF